MKKAIIYLILFSFSFTVYPFWIWSPKTQEWKNPKYSPLSTPYLQHKEAVKLFVKDNFKEAHHEFRKLLIHYPDAKEAAEAQYYLARCLEKLDRPYDAFLEYQKLIDSYPNSQRINETIEREYNIGEYFLNRESRKWLGVSIYDFVDHPAIEIFRKIVDKTPYSEYASRAQYKLGIIFMQLSRYDEARAAFGKVIDNYSDSEWAASAKYQLAAATAKAFPGVDYDSSYLDEAASRLDEFIEDHPQVQISMEAKEQLKELRGREAKKEFDIAQFYEKQDQYKSAIIYYEKVIDNYPDSRYYDISIKRIGLLNKLIGGNITKKDLEKKEKKEIAEVRKTERLRLKEEKTRKKKELKEQKRQEKLEKAAWTKAKKQAIRKEKQREKQERKEQKLKKREELFKKKQEAKEKTKEKPEYPEKKEKLREEKIYEELESIEENRDKSILKKDKNMVTSYNNLEEIEGIRREQ